MGEAAGSRTTSTREAIIAAARELIRGHGVEGMSISQVVAHSGTSTGAIYHHFGNKEQLVLAVGKSALAAPVSMVMRTTPGISPAGICAAALQRVAEDEQLPKTLLQIWSGAQSNPHLAELISQETTLMRAAAGTFIQQWLAAAQVPGVDGEDVVSLIFGLVGGFTLQRALGMPVDLDSYLNSAVAAVRLATHQDPAASTAPDRGI
ncbi:MAG: TetR/AcrR family transcriptional regulator [Propioniciclava sp.]